jgi:hypothetical protein
VPKPFHYEDAIDAAFAYGTVPDGYAGGTANVLFALHPDQFIIAVAPCGWFRYGNFDCVVDAREAFHLLSTYPSEARITHLRRLP